MEPSENIETDDRLLQPDNEVNNIAEESEDLESSLLKSFKEVIELAEGLETNARSPGIQPSSHEYANDSQVPPIFPARNIERTPRAQHTFDYVHDQEAPLRQPDGKRSYVSPSHSALQKSEGAIIPSRPSHEFPERRRASRHLANPQMLDEEREYDFRARHRKIETVCIKRAFKYEHEWEKLDDYYDNDDNKDEDRDFVRDDSVQVHVHLGNASNVKLHGNMILKYDQKEERPFDFSTRSEMQLLRKDTEQRITDWTEGMVLTEAAKRIIDLVLQGRTWVTVTGGPGEGKTTASFLALKSLHNMGRMVFYLRHPGDYFKLKASAGSVLMLDDIFGPSLFNLTNMAQWTHVINDILAVTEHQDVPETVSGLRTGSRTLRRKKRQQTVILVSRLCVLQSASQHLGRFTELISDPEGFVNLTQIHSSVEERMAIWNCHAERFGIVVAEDDVYKVCQQSLDLPYGFPHCCKLYASRSVYPLNRSLSMELFFSKPLEFLNQAMKSYMNEKNAGILLREMLKGDGFLNLQQVDNDRIRFEFGHVVNRLKGTLLSLEGDVVRFNHTSVYDSAAFVLCNIDPKFVLENCSISFLNERVRLSGSLRQQSDDCELIATIDITYTELFMKRLQIELEQNNLALALCHESFYDKHFVNGFMNLVIRSSKTEDPRELLRRRDRESGMPFIFLTSISGSEMLLKCVCQYIDLSGKEQLDALFGACEHVSLSSLNFLLSKFENLNLNATNADSNTPLLVSASKSSEKMLRLLLERRVKVNVYDRNGNTPLHLICDAGVDGDGSVVKMLVDRGLNLEEDSQSFPSKPLHIASLRGHVNVVRALLERGANISTTDLWGDTPLHTASAEGHVGVVEALIDGGADVHSLDTWGDTPLYIAATCGHVNMVKTFIIRGANVNVKNQSGDTALASSCVEGHTGVVKALIDGNADVNMTGSSGKTPLQIACENGHVSLVNVLAVKGEVNHKPPDGDYPLIHACLSGNFSVVSSLLKNGAVVNVKGKRGETPLHAACYSGNMAVVKALLNQRPSIHAKDDEGETPLYISSKFGNLDVTRLLLKMGASGNQR